MTKKPIVVGSSLIDVPLKDIPVQKAPNTPPISPHNVDKLNNDSCCHLYQYPTHITCIYILFI